MLLLQDLGFRVAVFVILVIFPATFFVLRRKWRIAVARKEEINRLLVLASEEADRAEIEASFGYYSSSISIPPAATRFCAVCFTPTPNRCARCKSVHYCSGKCQIIHWRQGHKDECHPLVNIREINDKGDSFAADSVKQFHFEEDTPSYSSGIQYDQDEITLEKPKITTSTHSSPELSINDDKSSIHDPSIKDDPELHSDSHIISDSSESRASSSSDGTCIDDSLSDIDSPHDLNADPSDSFPVLDNLESATIGKNEEQNRSLEEEKSYSGAPSSNNMFISSDLKEKASSSTTSPSSLNISHSDKNISNTLPTSGFWDGSLDYCRSKKYEEIADAKPDVSDMYSQGLELSSLHNPGYSNTGEVVSEPNLIEKDTVEPTRDQNSTILVSKEPLTSFKVVNSDKDLVKSREFGVTCETTKDSAPLQLSASKKAKAKTNDIEGSSKHTIHSPVSNKVGVLPKPTNVPSTSSSGMMEPIAPSIKSVRGVSNTVMPSQISRPSPSSAIGLKTSVLKVVEQFRAPRLSKQSDEVGRNVEKAVFPYEMFVKLYHWNKVELRPCGLINCGNSCYANAILQCLAFTPPLTAYLLQGLHSKSCVKKEWCFICEFERLILKAKEGRSPLSPIGILSQIQKIGSQLSNGREEDAHEFLRYAIDTMQSTCLQDAGLSAPGSLQEETTLVGLTFGGYLRSKIKCTRCHGKSEKQERMMDLTVEIGGDIETLEDALRKFTGTEALDGENKYHCGRCKSYEKAKKKLNILEAPNILTIALKRFQSGKFGKLNKRIRFPEILNLAPYMRGGNDKSPIYRLYGVVVHLDIMNAAFSGHYVCYVRNSQNKWFKIDDSMVKPVEVERVRTKEAYMLFYSRVSPRAPRSIRSAIVSHDLPSKAKTSESGPQRNPRSTSTSRQRDPSSLVTRAFNDDLATLGYVPQSGTSLPPGLNILDFDSSSDNSSLFSHSDEVSSSTTDSNRDSISTDDFSEYIFGYNAFFRHSSDSDTSSSSSSSSPEYTKRSPLSNPERYSSSRDISTNEKLGSVGGGSFLDSNISSKQVRKVVNISSSRETDAEKLGWANPLDNGKPVVNLRRSSRKKAD